jgi:sigma-54 specific flagellar transcriptional regulator A
LEAHLSQRKFKQLENRLVGSSSGIKSVRHMIAKVTQTDATVLIQGESGTGKEIIAQLIHDLSDRASQPFVPINCGAIPSELIESELFGHEKGAFTGALAARKGRFEMADGGTLFLDEIGDMPFDMQVKLLRVLQESTFERVGGTKSIASNVRIIAATHQNLDRQIDDGGFRADLYYRLSVFPIDVPPLRERPGDVALLINTFLQSAKRDGKGVIDLKSDAMACLDAYEWPGNVRELANLIERLLVMFPGSSVGKEELPTHFTRQPGEQGRNGVSHDEGPQLNLLQQDDLDELFGDVEPLASDGLSIALNEPLDLKAKLADLERELIIAALDNTDWVTAHAANWLKLQRTTLVEKMRKYDIKR